MFSLSFSAVGQVIINEICSRNASLIRDEEDDCEDWIELYNKSEKAVNLSGYFLSDEAKTPAKWKFPEIILQPYSHLVVLASGKDRIKPLDQGASVAHAEEKWEYLVSPKKIHDDWIEMDYSLSGWTSTHVDEGVNDGDGFPVFSPPNTTVYTRKKLVVFDMDNVKKATLETSADFSVRVFVNGMEVKPLSAKKEDRLLVYNVYLFLQTGINLVAVEFQNSNEYSEIKTANLALELSEYIPEYVMQEFDTFKFYLQTNFKLTRKGETVLLSDATGKILDKVSYRYHHLNHSYGRKQDGSAEWAFFYQPTPERSNAGATSYSGYTEEVPQFSIQAGHYSRGSKLEISCDGSSRVVRYTVDGSVPDFSSQVFTAPVRLDSTMVVRAACFAKDLLPGETATNTYLINEKISLPVISISTNPKDLWSEESGIFASSGVIDWLDDEDVEANFWKDWEIPAHVEFFSEKEKREFSGEYGVKVHGAASRKYPQKSLRIFGADAFGKNSIDYRMFPEKNIDSYRRILVRNGGNEWNKTHFRDGFVSRSVAGVTHNDVQAFRPSIVFINGKYWGVMNLREQVGRYYAEENYGINGDSIEFMEKSHSVLGTRLNFDKMLYFIRNNDLRVAANYDSVKSMLDVTNYCDYIITEVFYDNTDWPGNNVKLWRHNVPGGKWRYILFDLDLSMGYKKSDQVHDAHTRILNSTASHAEIFTGLLKSPEFRNYFINRYADLLNTVFLPSRLKEIILSIKAEIEMEMPRHLDRWNLTLASWNEEVNKLLSFVEKRPNESWDYIKKSFGISSQVLLTLGAEAKESGTIKINTITAKEFPWSGIYFSGIPVQLEAVPNPGFEFAGWTIENENFPETSITRTFQKDAKIVANFRPAKSR